MSLINKKKYVDIKENAEMLKYMQWSYMLYVNGRMNFFWPQSI